MKNEKPFEEGRDTSTLLPSFSIVLQKKKKMAASALSFLLVIGGTL